MSRTHLPSRAILALLLALTAASTALAHPTAQEDRARAVSSRLIAPCCYQQTLDVHESELATALRAEIASRLRAGESPAQVEDSLVERYGERVRAVPRDHDTRAHVLVLVALAMLVAAGLLGRAMRQWSRREGAVPVAAPAPSKDRDAWDERLDAELRALDEA